MSREVDKAILDKNDYEFTQNQHNQFYLNYHGPKLPEIPGLFDQLRTVNEEQEEENHDDNDSNSEENSRLDDSIYNKNNEDFFPFDEGNGIPLETNLNQ
jgi:hypothetical protein